MGFYSELSFKERGKKIAQCLPFFIFLTIFRVTSFSLVHVVLRVYSIIIYIVLLSILFLGLLMSTSSSSAKKYVRETRKKKGLIYFVVLPFRTMLTYYMFTTGNKGKETVIMVFWFICNTIMVLSLSFVVNLNLRGQFLNIKRICDFLNLNKVQLVKYHLAFNVTIAVIILSGIASISLYLLHIR